MSKGISIAMALLREQSHTVYYGAYNAVLAASVAHYLADDVEDGLKFAHELAHTAAITALKEYFRLTDSNEDLEEL